MGSGLPDKAYVWYILGQTALPGVAWETAAGGREAGVRRASSPAEAHREAACRRREAAGGAGRTEEGQV